MGPRNSALTGTGCPRNIGPRNMGRALRAASLRWHPDKFLQQFGGRLQSAAAHEEVMAEVNAVSAALNGMVDWVRVHGQ